MYRKRRSTSAGSEDLDDADFSLVTDDETLRNTVSPRLAEWRLTASMPTEAEGQQHGPDSAEMLPSEWNDMPQPGVRAPKTQAHHRRTSSRIMEELSTTPVFEEKILGKKVAKTQLPQETSTWLLGGDQKAATPWRFCFYFAAVLTCSLMMETAVDRGQKAYACERLVLENQQLAQQLDMYRFETKQRMSALAHLLGKEVMDKTKLKEELEDEKRWREYLEAGKAGKTGKTGKTEDVVPPEEQNRGSSWWKNVILVGRQYSSKIRQDWQRLLLCVRLRAAQPVRYIRNNLRITMESKLYRELKWLEEVIRGPFE